MIFKKIKCLLSIIFLNKPSPEWYVKDTCGTICAIVTWMLIIYAQFVVYLVILPPWFYADKLQEDIILKNPRLADSSNRLSFNDQKLQLLAEHHKAAKSQEILSSSFVAVLNAILFGILSLFAFTSHVRAMFSDPGTTELGNASPESIARMNFPSGHVLYKCTKCASIKPERAHHCSTCRRCVKRMDHHCPWINNCVGEKNQKYFVLFTFYICAISAHALCMLIHRFIVCANFNWSTGVCSLRSPTVTILAMISLTFEACLFFLFTAIMFGTQVYAICADETGIEQLKGDMAHKRETRNSKWLNFKQVFGDKFSFKWAIPFYNPSWAKGDISLLIV